MQNHRLPDQPLILPFAVIRGQMLTLISLRRMTSVEQGRAVVGLFPITDRIGIIGSLLTIATGLYMTLTV